MSSQETKTIEVLKGCAYFVGAELLLRMTKGALFYESSKYIIILFACIGMFFRGISGRGWPYFLYLMLLIPSIFVASTTLSYDANFRTNIAFVLSGPVCLGFASLFFYEKKITMKTLNKVLEYALLPIVSVTAYIFLYSPSIKEVLNSTASNNAASGGFGANQVATILGLGIAIVIFRLFILSKSIEHKIINVIILALMSYRALITFSRGGVITAVIVILIFIFFFFKSASRRKKLRVVFTVAAVLVITAMTWTVSSQKTSGFIDLRYTNRDHMGREKQDITTGRAELFKNEIEGFLRSPFLGIGSSRAKDRRIEVEGQGVTSHSEFSRILAEHGLLGVAILTILLLKPFYVRAINPYNYYFYAFLAFWFLTINHSTMRLAAPAFFYSLALLNVVNEKNPVHRKRIKVD